MKTILIIGAVFLFTQSAFAVTIYVSNLSYAVDQADLTDFFGEYGLVTLAYIPINNETGRSVGYVYVEIPDDAEAEKAIKGMNGRVIHGYRLALRYAIPEELQKLQEVKDNITRKISTPKRQRVSGNSPKALNAPPKVPETPKKTETTDTNQPDDEGKTVKLYVGNLSFISGLFTE